VAILPGSGATCLAVSVPRAKEESSTKLSSTVTASGCGPVIAYLLEVVCDLHAHGTPRRLPGCGLSRGPAEYGPMLLVIASSPPRMPECVIAPCWPGRSSTSRAFADAPGSRPTSMIADVRAVGSHLGDRA
jgi:hypothetical protein